ncbi:hypothetical protein LCGC14_1747740 [marine sediment metagenome]|uniref:Uncharacterized protein n=1 Tax=marine sediment metagenome TaxID=412755 RepID=A0A0F9H4U4_9ZZZZ
MAKNRSAKKWFHLADEVDEFFLWYERICKQRNIPQSDIKIEEKFKWWKKNIYLKNVKRHGERTQARRTDPYSSHFAASKVNIIKSDHAILRAIQNGYTTIKEVSHHLNPEKETSYSPRFAPLRRAGLIEVIGKKKNEKTGMTVNEYALTPEGEKAVS